MRTVDDPAGPDADEVFTLLGKRRDGVSPAVDVVVSSSLAGALAEARSFLAEHRSCEAVEVWVDDRRLAIIERT